GPQRPGGGAHPVFADPARRHNRLPRGHPRRALHAATGQLRAGRHALADGEPGRAASGGAGDRNGSDTGRGPGPRRDGAPAAGGRGRLRTAPARWPVVRVHGDPSSDLLVGGGERGRVRPRGFGRHRRAARGSRDPVRGRVPHPSPFREDLVRVNLDVQLAPEMIHEPVVPDSGAASPDRPPGKQTSFLEPDATTSDALLEIEDLSLWYGSTQALHGVNLQVPRNKVTALIGPSGCGKSTLLRSINRMNDLIPDVRVRGRIAYEGVDVNGPQVDPVDVRRRIGMVFQKANPFP